MPVRSRPLIVGALLGLGACAPLGDPFTAPDATDATGDQPAPEAPPTDAPGGDADAPPWTLQGAVLRRLTVAQHARAIDQLFGPGLPLVPLEPDTNPYLFTSIGASTTTLSEVGVQQLEEAADTLAGRVFADPVWRLDVVGCEARAPGDACSRGFLADFGRLALRRTLTADELTGWTRIATDLSGGDAWAGLRAAVTGILQSPGFVYRIELGAPDPSDPSRRKYTGAEMASRLAFLLWDAPPDDALLTAGELGELDTVVGLETHARRMLADPRARDAIQDFFAEYLDLRRLDGMTRNAEAYPSFTSTLPDAFATEVRLMVDDLVFRRRADVRTLFSTRRTFVNAELAALYAVDAPEASPITFVPVELPADGPRGGVLTTGAFLSINAHEVTTSPTLRGKYLRERVLCQEVPPPPPDVNTMLDESTTTPQTLREQLEAHRADPACAGCHVLMDPPGLLFEHFDAMGGYRTVDHGQPIDASGDLDGVPLSGPRELGALLATDERVGPCITKQLFRHAQGRLEDRNELKAIADLANQFAAAEHRFDELLVALVTHDTFRYVAPPQDTP